MAWLGKFKPDLPPRYDCTADPAKFLQLYELGIEAANGDEGAPPRAPSYPGHVGLSLWHVSPLVHVFSLLYWGRPSGCIIPKVARAQPSGDRFFLRLSKWICFFMANVLDLIARSIDTN